MKLESMRVAAWFAGLVLAGCAATAKDAGIPAATAHPPRQSDIDVEHYAIALSLHPETRTIEGVCTVRLYPSVEKLERVHLDLAGLAVAEVRDSKQRTLRFAQAGEVLTIELAEPLARRDFVELAIAYGGSPAKGLWFTRERNGAATQVFTQGECEDARYWFPCLDAPSDRATSEVQVEMPEGWTAVAAGERVEREPAGAGRVRERWRMFFPHPTYLTTLVAGELVERDQAWDGIGLSYLAAPELEPYLADCFAETDEVLDFLTDLTGVRYPYPKYSQACVDNFPFGGMENISATTLTDTWLGDERLRRDGERYGLIAHEAAHQWFGDFLTCSDWSHIWLNEGWATYATLLYTQATRGEDEFRAAVRDAQDSHVALDVGTQRRPIVYDVFREPMDLFFSGHVYQGAAVRLNLLRFVLGDEAFFRGLREYVAENRGRGVTTDDYQRAMEHAAGRDLGWFFQPWFHGRGHPEFQVRWSHDEARGEVEVVVEQVQPFEDGTPAVFAIPAEIELRVGKELATERVELAKRQETFRFPSRERPTWVRFDPKSWIPKRIEEIKGLDEWLAMASECQDVLGRRDAIRALGLLAGREHDKQALRLILGTLQDRADLDPSVAVRLAAVRAIGSLAPAAGRQALLAAAANDASASVRSSALAALAPWGEDPELASFARSQFEAGYSWGTMGAAAALYAKACPERASAFLREQLELDSPHDVLRASLLTALGRVPDPDAHAALAQWAFDDSRSPESREAAVRALAESIRGEPEIRRGICALLETREYRLRGAAIAALVQSKDPAASAALEAYYPRCNDARQRRAIENVLRTERTR
jgi:aminopeptidase N